MFKKPATIAILMGAVIFGIIYFGLDTKPSKQKALEKSRAEKFEVTGIQNLLSSAKSELSNEQSAFVESLNKKVRDSNDEDSKIEALKTLASGWYEMGFPVISGYYAEEVAELDGGHDAWALAGTTYILGMRKSGEEARRIFARNRAVKALESAISLDSENISDKLNLALIYVEAPDKSPMEGILMLKDLNEKHPDDVSILNQLGRLSIQTNQTDKAIMRLTRSYKIDPENRNTICLLASAYEQAGEDQKASLFQKKCKK